MLIAGAKGFAIEVLEILHQLDNLNEVFFFDNKSSDLAGTIYGFKIIKSENEVGVVFENNPAFVLGLGGTSDREKMSKLLTMKGGKLTSLVSPRASIGHFGVELGMGVSIMTGTIITNNISVGEGTLINLNCTIGHDSKIGKYCDISPNCNISGGCQIGDYCHFGTNSILLPKVKVGNNVTIGAGSVVTKNIEDNSLVVGIPAKKIKDIDPI